MVDRIHQEIERYAEEVDGEPVVVGERVLEVAQQV